MQPSSPFVPFTRSLRPVEHPDLSPVLTHFCGRGRSHAHSQGVPDEIVRMSPQERLESILWDEHLRAFVTFSGGDPAVCFTESTWHAGVKFLIDKRGYPPWGLVLGRDSVYAAGGAPVWYASDPRNTGRCLSSTLDFVLGLLDWSLSRIGSKSVSGASPERPASLATLGR